MIKNTPVTIEYRNVKNINLYVKPPDGHILVTAPKSVSKKRIMDFLTSKESWIEKATDKMLRTQKRREQDTAANVTPQQLDQLKEAVKKYADKWEPVMGVHASSWTIRDMKTRWGSCTVNTGRIRINRRLAQYPEEFLEYIVVHELCHLIEPSHNQRFKQYMTYFMPDWSIRKSKAAQIL